MQGTLGAGQPPLCPANQPICCRPVPVQLVAQLPLHYRTPAEAILLDMYTAPRPRCYGLCPMLDYITKPGCRPSVSLGAAGQLPCAGHQPSLQRPALLHAAAAAGAASAACCWLSHHAQCFAVRLLWWPAAQRMAAAAHGRCLLPAPNWLPETLAAAQACCAPHRPLQEEEWEALCTRMAAFVLAR